MDHEAIKAAHDAQMQELASRPNTSVYTVQHDDVAEAWPAARVSAVLELIACKVHEFEASTPDFVVRKKCLEFEEILSFQRRHPQLYWLVTDREKMAVPKYRQAVAALVEVRRRVDGGEVPEGAEASAAATRTVFDALK